MEGQTVYTSFDCLDEVFLFKEEDEIHSFLHDVITDYSNVMVDMDDLEFDKLIDENPFIKSLVKRPDKKIFPLKPFFDNIESEDLSNFPRDIFLLKKPKSFCDTAMEKFGVLTLKSDKLSEIDRSFLVKMATKKLLPKKSNTMSISRVPIRITIGGFRICLVLNAKNW